MANTVRRAKLAVLLLLSCGCASKQAQIPPPAPPQPKASLVVLLPDANGKAGAITLTNSAGTQQLTEPNHAIRMARRDAAPPPPVAIDQADVRKVFGSVLDALPAAEVVFRLYFDSERDLLLAEGQAQLPAILEAIRERRSTSITVIGHTDTTADPKFNYRLGLRRAEGVAGFLRARGIDSSSLVVASHGDADLAVKTGRGVAERLNRRVEVIVR